MRFGNSSHHPIYNTKLIFQHHNPNSLNTTHPTSKMRTSILATTFLSTLASARITGLSAPSTLAPNSTFSFTLLTTNYVQSVSDVAVAWGFQLPTASNPTGFPYTLGSFANSSYLGPEKSNVLTNVSVEATVPEELEGEAYMGKDVVFSVAVMSLYGASAGPVTQSWNVTVKIGEEEGCEVVESQGEGWKQSASC
jgi:hypothetical protein